MKRPSSVPQKVTREEWLALPPLTCHRCARKRPRSEFYTLWKTCKPCAKADRVAKGSDSTARYQRRALAATQLGADGAAAAAVDGADFMEMAQAELYPGRTYASLAREQCGAVRRRALALFAKASAPATAAATSAEPERRTA